MKKSLYFIAQISFTVSLSLVLISPEVKAWSPPNCESAPVINTLPSGCSVGAQQLLQTYTTAAASYNQTCNTAQSAYTTWSNSCSSPNQIDMGTAGTDTAAQAALLGCTKAGGKATDGTPCVSSTTFQAGMDKYTACRQAHPMPNVTNPKQQQWAPSYEALKAACPSGSIHSQVPPSGGVIPDKGVAAYVPPDCMQANQLRIQIGKAIVTGSPIDPSEGQALQVANAACLSAIKQLRVAAAAQQRSPSSVQSTQPVDNQAASIKTRAAR